MHSELNAVQSQVTERVDKIKEIVGGYDKIEELLDFPSLKHHTSAMARLLNELDSCETLAPIGSKTVLNASHFVKEHLKDLESTLVRMNKEEAQLKHQIKGAKAEADLLGDSAFH